MYICARSACRAGAVCGCGVIGSHVRLRIWCFTACEFESRQPHPKRRECVNKSLFRGDFDTLSSCFIGDITKNKGPCSGRKGCYISAHGRENSAEIAFERLGNRLRGSAMNHRHSSGSDSPIRGHGGKQPSNPLR